MSRTVSAVMMDRPPEIRALPFGDTPDGADATNLLTVEQQGQVRGIATLLSFRPRNKVIFAEGTEATFVYLVVSGLVRVSHCCESGKQQVVAFMKPGDIFGFPEQGNYAHTARSMGNVWLYRMTWWRLQELMRRDPALQAALFTRAAFDLRQAQKHIILLGQQSVPQRLASFFLDLMKYDEFYDTQRKALSLPPCRFDLAEFLGTRPETVVRGMAWLEAKGLIRRTTSRLVTILNAEGLGDLLNEARRRD